MPRDLFRGAIFIVLTLGVAAGYTNVTFSQDWRSKEDRPEYSKQSKDSRQNTIDDLKYTIDAQREDIATKDNIIREQDRLIDDLRKRNREQQDKLSDTISECKKLNAKCNPRQP